LREANTTICPKCNTSLNEISKLYTRDLMPGSKINETDVSGKSLRQLHGVSASGIAIGHNMSKKQLENFFNSTTGISIMEVKLVCSKCGYTTNATISS
jgi:hypothetical protein